MKILTALLLILFSCNSYAVSCFITQYENVMELPNGDLVPVGGTRFSHMTPVTFTSTSTQSAIFSPWANIIRVICDAKSFWDIGASPTASTADSYVAADAKEYFGVVGGSWRIAFRDDS